MHRTSPEDCHTLRLSLSTVLMPKLAHFFQWHSSETTEVPNSTSDKQSTYLRHLCMLWTYLG